MPKRIPIHGMKNGICPQNICKCYPLFSVFNRIVNAMFKFSATFRGSFFVLNVVVFRRSEMNWPASYRTVVVDAFLHLMIMKCSSIHAILLSSGCKRCKRSVYSLLHRSLIDTVQLFQVNYFFFPESVAIYLTFSIILTDVIRMKFIV